MAGKCIIQKRKSEILICYHQVRGEYGINMQKDTGQQRGAGQASPERRLQSREVNCASNNSEGRKGTCKPHKAVRALITVALLAILCSIFIFIVLVFEQSIKGQCFICLSVFSTTSPTSTFKH